MVIALGAMVLHGEYSASAWLLALSITGGYWLAFAINDYFDQTVDALDPNKRHKNYFVVVPTSPQKALIGFLIAAVLIAPGMLQFGWRGFFISAGCVAVMWAYSAPPFRLKSRPGLDLPIHAMFVETYPYILVMVLLQLAWRPLDFVILGLGVFASLTAQLEQQVRDHEVDHANGEVNFTLWFGVENSLLLLKILSVLMVGYGFTFMWLGIIPLWIAPIGLFAVPAVLSRLWRKPGQPRPEHLIRPVVYFVLVYAIGLLIWNLI